MVTKIIDHLNAHHQGDMLALAKKFGTQKHIEHVEVKSVDTKGLDLLCDGEDLRVDFPKEVLPSQLKEAIIELCQSVPKTLEYDKIKSELLEFRDGFKSVVIASIDANSQAIASYAPLLKYQGRFFIYISEIAEHFRSIQAHPDRVEVLFLEDEKEAKSVILRKRLRYRTTVEFKPKDEEFEKIFARFEEDNPHAGGLKTIKKMQDFHLLELHFKEGRFVKGFGAAYDINAQGEVKFAAADMGNPHTLPHR